MSTPSTPASSAVGALLQHRAASSEQRLAEIRREIETAVPELQHCPDLCVYATGSFGRREASRYSDLDLFFVLDDKGVKEAAIPKLTKTLIDADLIRLCERLGFPKFSNDGVYLRVHTITNLAKQIGDQHEDSENLFTARMLLFLESAPLFNDAVYQKAINACRDEYFRDHSDHADNFRPLFLVNDIARYWKTLCLNYEAARTNATEEDKPKHRLKNLKLKHSRMMTCYSMLACLCDRLEGDAPAKLSRLVQMPPAQRLNYITSKHEAKDARLTDLYKSLVGEYEWFLQETDREKGEALRWAADEKDLISKRSSRFGDMMYDLLKAVAEATGADLRYLVV